MTDIPQEASAFRFKRHTNVSKKSITPEHEQSLAVLNTEQRDGALSHGQSRHRPRSTNCRSGLVRSLSLSSGIISFSLLDARCVSGGVSDRRPSTATTPSAESPGNRADDASHHVAGYNGQRQCTADIATYVREQHTLYSRLRYVCAYSVNEWMHGTDGPPSMHMGCPWPWRSRLALPDCERAVIRYGRIVCAAEVDEYEVRSNRP